MLRIKEINSEEEFYRLKDSWDQTLNESKDNSIFLTWEKMAPSVEYLGKNSSLKILCATDGNKIIGIAPFRRTHISVKGLIGYNIIEPLTNGETDYNGLIISERQNQCVNEFLTHLFKQKDWDFMLFPDLPQASPSLIAIERANNPPFFELEKGVICPYISLPKSKDQLLGRLNKKFEKKLKKSISKLEREQGKVELKSYKEIGSLEHALKILFDLHQKRWNSKGDSGKFVDKRSQHITLQTAKYFEEKGWLRLYFLIVNGKPVAVELNIEYLGKMYCHLKGFDPNYYKYRVGSLLTLKILEDCIERGLIEYDFMQGDEAYKFDWTNMYRQSVNLKWVNQKLFAKLVYSGFKVMQKTKLYPISIRYIIAVKAIFNIFLSKPYRNNHQ